MQDFAETLFDDPEADELEGEELENDDPEPEELDGFKGGVFLHLVPDDALEIDVDIDEDEISDGEVDEVLSELTRSIRADLKDGKSDEKKRHGPSPSRRDFLLQQFIKEGSGNLLTKKEEVDLGVRAQGKGLDAKLAQQELVARNGRFVVKLAMKFLSKAKGLTLMDLIQEGNLGLIRAAEKFDPKHDVKFASYAAWWIKSYIRATILRNHSMIRRGTTQQGRAVFSNIGRIQHELRRELMKKGANREAKPQEIADRLNCEKEERLNEKEDRPKKKKSKGGRPITADDVISILTRNDDSANTPLRDSHGVEGVTTRQDMLKSKFPSPEAALVAKQDSSRRSAALQEALEQLPSREMEIIERRHLNYEKETLQEVGSSLGISRERVRQLEVRAMKRLRELMQEQLST